MVLKSINSWLGIWIILKLSVVHCGCCLTNNHSLLFCHYLPISWLMQPRSRLTSRPGKKIQGKERKSELLSIWLQHRVSLVSSINIIASALSMRDVLHCLIPKSSVCILTTCSLIETVEIVSYCYLWIFGYIAAIRFRPSSSLTAAQLNVGLMWWVRNHNLRGGQETFQLFYSLHKSKADPVTSTDWTGKDKVKHTLCCNIVLSLPRRIALYLFTHGETKEMRKENHLASLASTICF